MFPTPWTVTVHDSEPSEVRDEYGNVTMVQTDRSEPVFGWAPRTSDTEDFTVGGTTVGRVLDVYAPAGFDVTPSDRVTVDAVLYEVIGYPEDFTHGPFGFRPGVRVALRRIEEAG